MSRRPPVSVLTTCFNREAYFAQAIESVLNSSFSDFEYIIVDDASTDGTLEIAHEYARLDKRIQVHANDRNLGDYPNRNKAASLARGDYIKYVDSDDIIYPHGLHVMIDAMRKFPQAGLGLCRPHDRDHPFPYVLKPVEVYQRHYFGSGVLGNAPSSAIIRREAFVAVGGFSGKRHIGDSELWHSISRTFDTVLIVQGLTWWRKHGDQELAEERRSLNSVGARFELAINAIRHPDCPLVPEQRDAAAATVRAAHALEIMGIARRRSYSIAKKIAISSGLRPHDFVRAIASRIAG